MPIDDTRKHRPRFVASKLKNNAYLEWLVEPVFRLHDAVITNESVGNVCPNTRALRLLNGSLADMGIRTLGQLYRVPMVDIAAHEGVGERQLIAAACVLDAYGYDILPWIAATRTRSTGAAAKVATTKAAKRRAGKRTYTRAS